MITFSIGYALGTVWCTSPIKTFFSRYIREGDRDLREIEMISEMEMVRKMEMESEIEKGGDGDS